MIMFNRVVCFWYDFREHAIFSNIWNKILNRIVMEGSPSHFIAITVVGVILAPVSLASSAPTDSEASLSFHMQKEDRVDITPTIPSTNAKTEELDKNVSGDFALSDHETGTENESEAAGKLHMFFYKKPLYKKPVLNFFRVKKPSTHVPSAQETVKRFF